jgi:hypothetical protein
MPITGLAKPVKDRNASNQLKAVIVSPKPEDNCGIKGMKIRLLVSTISRIKKNKLSSSRPNPKKLNARFLNTTCIDRC